jgi:hypothetical protein
MKAVSIVLHNGPKGGRDVGEPSWKGKRRSALGAFVSGHEVERLGDGAKATAIFSRVIIVKNGMPC